MIFFIAFRLGSGAPKIASLVLDSLAMYPLIEALPVIDSAIHGAVEEYPAIEGTPKVNKWLQ